MTDDYKIPEWDTAERYIDRETVENWKKFGGPLAAKQFPAPLEFDLPAQKTLWMKIKEFIHDFF
jgi:hypothetical protein